MYPHTCSFTKCSFALLWLCRRSLSSHWNKPELGPTINIILKSLLSGILLWHSCPSLSPLTIPHTSLCTRSQDGVLFKLKLLWNIFPFTVLTSMISFSKIYCYWRWYVSMNRPYPMFYFLFKRETAKFVSYYYTKVKISKCLQVQLRIIWFFFPYCP